MVAKETIRVGTKITTLDSTPAAAQAPRLISSQAKNTRQ